MVRIDSAIVVRRGAHTLSDSSAFVNSAGQLLLPGGVRPEWITSACYLNSIQCLFSCSLMLFAFTKLWNTSLVNCRPLSLCKCFCSPYRENTSHNSCTVLSVDVDPVYNTSGGVQCASTMIRNICPTKGPV